MRAPWKTACLGAAALSLLTACPRAGRRVEPLAISVPYEIDTLDPHARNIAGSFAIASHFYEPLVAADPSLELRPALAERWDNPDASTWIFHLRRGVTFHSGKPLTSADVVYSFQRLAGTPGLEIAVYLAGVESVHAVDPFTVRLETRRPSAILLASIPFVLIVPVGSSAGSLAKGEDGTGPYRLSTMTPEGEIRMSRSETYHGRKPAFAAVVFHTRRAPELALEDLRSGRSRLVQCNSRKLEAGVRDVSGMRMVRKASLFVKHLSFDLVRETTPFAGGPGDGNPFRRREVRQAISLAVDRQALVRGLSTFAMPASQPLPPFVFGYDPALQVPSPDPARARALLSEAGYPGGFTTTLHTRTAFEETGRIVAGMLSAVGIRTTLAVQTDPDFFDAMSKDKVSFMLSRFGCPTGDADLLFQQRFRTPGAWGTGGRGSAFSPGSAELDAAIDASSEVLAMPKRRAALQQLIRKVTDDLLWVPLYIDEDVYAVAEGLAWQPRSDSYVLAAEVSAAP